MRIFRKYLSFIHLFGRIKNEIKDFFNPTTFIWTFSYNVFGTLYNQKAETSIFIQFLTEWLSYYCLRFYYLFLLVCPGENYITWWWWLTISTDLFSKEIPSPFHNNTKYLILCYGNTPMKSIWYVIKRNFISVPRYTDETRTPIRASNEPSKYRPNSGSPYNPGYNQAIWGG